MHVGLAQRVELGGDMEPPRVRQAYEGLMKLPEYVQAISRSTADETFVRKRLDLSREAFSTV